jgi:superfamily II DNA or RNA helicase
MQNTNLTWRIYKTTDKYFNYGKKGYMFCEIGLMLDNLSKHQIEALSNLLRGINDCFISQPTGSGKSAVYQSINQTISLYFLSLLIYEAFQLL